MGPRLVGRGKFPQHIADTDERLKLQWGRVLWDAESHPSKLQTAVGVGLQWGRVLWDAERSVLPSADSVGGYDAEIERLSGRAFA